MKKDDRKDGVSKLAQAYPEGQVLNASQLYAHLDRMRGVLLHDNPREEIKRAFVKEIAIAMALWFLQMQNRKAEKSRRQMALDETGHVDEVGEALRFTRNVVIGLAGKSSYPAIQSVLRHWLEACPPDWKAEYKERAGIAPLGVRRDDQGNKWYYTATGAQAQKFAAIDSQIQVTQPNLHVSVFFAASENLGFGRSSHKLTYSREGKSSKANGNIIVLPGGHFVDDWLTKGVFQENWFTWAGKFLVHTDPHYYPDRGMASFQLSSNSFQVVFQARPTSMPFGCIPDFFQPFLVEYDVFRGARLTINDALKIANVDRSFQRQEEVFDFCTHASGTSYISKPLISKLLKPPKRFQYLDDGFLILASRY